MTAAIASYAIRSPKWVLTYEGVNVTADISAMILAIRYEDRLGNAAGTVEIDLEDHARRWQGPWYPQLGDTLNLRIGYQGEDLLDCGDFQVDEVELNGPPDTMTLRCLSAFVTASMRTRNSAAYEGMSAIEIAALVAEKHGLQLISLAEVEDLGFARITQRFETDLEFLKRLADENNFEFTVRGSQLVFYPRAVLELAAPTFAIARRDVERISFRNRTRRIYRSSEVAYFNPDTKQLIAAAAAAPAPASGDTLKIVTRCENLAQAAVKAAAALRLYDMRTTEATVETPGMTRMVAGNVMSISGWGRLDGDYLIEAACHSIARSTGYSTSTTARRLD